MHDITTKPSFKGLHVLVINGVSVGLSVEERDADLLVEWMKFSVNDTKQLQHALAKKEKVSE